MDNGILAAQKQAEVRKLEAQATDKNVELTQLELQKQAIAKWNGVMPTTVSGNNGTIFSIPVK